MLDPSASEPPEVFDFVAQFLTDREGGQDLSLEHYLARFPGHAEAIAREYLGLVSAAPPPPPLGVATASIGPYRLVRELGRGGQAVVHLAIDTRVARKVALKVLPALAGSISRERLQRFRREAKLLAQLEHPGICGIYEADTEGGIPFLAMRYVEGETLARRLEERQQPPRTTMEITRILRWIERVARALHAAHEAGVIHRDVKPGNIMITPEDEPVVLDLGLAREEESEEASLTAPGVVFGTLAYMSPEQIAPRRTTLDRRTDVYSLGVTLYEALTGRKPFEAATREALWRAIETEHPIDPRALNPAVSADLRVVLLAALEKDPAARYPTALALADDLRCVREYEPIAARPVGAAARAWRWSQRNPALASALAGLFVLLATGLVITTVMLEDLATKQRDIDRAARWHALARRVDEAPQRALADSIVEASARQDDIANDVLMQALLVNHEQTRLIGHSDVIRALALSPDERFVATGSSDSTLRLWEFASGKLISVLRVHAAPVWSVAWSPDGTRLLSAGDDGVARVFERETWRELRVLGGHTAGVRSAEWSPDGTQVLTASLDGSARLFEAATGTLVRIVHAAPEHSLSIASFSSDGASIAIAGGHRLVDDTRDDRMLRVYDARTGLPRGPPLAHGHVLRSVAWNRDATHLVTTSLDGRVRMVHAHTCTLRWTAAFPSKVHDAKFSPDGRVVAVAFDSDPTESPSAALMDATDGAKMHALGGQRGRASKCCAFSPDGTQLAVVGNDRVVHVYDVASGRSVHAFIRLESDGYGVIWSRDGCSLLSWTSRFQAQVWQIRPPGFAEVETIGAPVTSVAFHPDGGRVLVTSRDGKVRIVDATSGRVCQVLVGHRAPVITGAFFAGGTKVLTASEDGTARIWEPGSGTTQVLEGHRGPVRIALVIAGDPPRALTASDDGTARLWNLATGRTLRVLEGHSGPITCAALSADHALAATGGSDRTIRIWDLRDDGPPPIVSTHFRGDWSLTSVFSVAFSPDGGHLASGSQDGYIRLLRTTDGSLAMETYVATPGTVRFAADQRVWATPRYGASVMRQDASGESFELVDTWSSGRPRSATLNPGGGLLLVTCADSTARLFRVRERDRWVTVHCGGAPVLCGAFSSDGARFAIGDADGVVRILPVDPLEAARATAPFLASDDVAAGGIVVNAR